MFVAVLVALHAAFVALVHAVFVALFHTSVWTLPPPLVHTCLPCPCSPHFTPPQLAILAPAGPDKDNLYHESHFVVIDPNGVKVDGDVVRYGDEFVLVDDHGMSWNHNAQTLSNYLGFSRCGLPGELCMKFTRPPHAPTPLAAAATHTPPTHTPPTHTPPTHAPPHNIGQPCVLFNSLATLTITRSSRTNKKQNHTISNFKRNTSRVMGGYLTCEKIGQPLTFKIQRAPPTVLTVTAFNYTNDGSMNLHTHHNINWGEEIELAVPTDLKLTDAQPLLSVTLSTGENAVFRQEQILNEPGKPFWVNVGDHNFKSRLLVQVRR